MGHLVIIGSGPAGYTAALYAGRAGLRPLVFAGAPSLEDPDRLPGGQLVTTTLIENFPGFPEGIDGTLLTDRFRAQAERHGAEVRFENVLSVDLSARPFRVSGDQTSTFADAIIVATGAQARWLHVTGEDVYRGRGVFACATCDGPLLADRDVAVVGGGDTALEEALSLARLCRSVRVIHRRGELRASRAMQERALAHPRVHFVWHSVVEEIVGNGEMLTGLRLRDTRSGAISELAVDGLFVAVGHRPATSLLQGQLGLDADGYLQTQPGSTATSVPGVFACGDVSDRRYRQAITAAATGCMAALDVERWLMENQSVAPIEIAAAA